jgi:mannosyltransferase OCH1-like enzyme
MLNSFLKHRFISHISSLLLVLVVLKIRKDSFNLRYVVGGEGTFAFGRWTRPATDSANATNMTEINVERLQNNKFHSVHHSITNDTSQGIDAAHETETDCIVMQDKVLPKNVTHPPGIFIPREIHFFVKSRCIPTDISNYMNQWTSLQNFSVFFHDMNKIYEFLQKPRPDMPFVSKALTCAFHHEAILDLTRLLWLYEHGGVSVDIDHKPGPAFLNGTETILDVDKFGFERHFVVEDESTGSPRFLAAEPGHYATYSSLLLSISMQYKQFQFNSPSHPISHYADSRNYVYRGVLGEYLGYDYNLPVSRKIGQNGKGQILILHGSRISGDVFVKIPLTEEITDRIKLIPISKDVDQCVNLKNNSFQVDIETLLNLTTGDHESPSMNNVSTCPDGLKYVKNTFVPESINSLERKIPKIVHMTSKSKCFSNPYAENAELWRFDGYSFFLHDDKAVHALINSKDWSEFPLLKEVLGCLVTGAALADLWRYLVLWEYGGIYTDMDNAPGSSFNGGAVIKNDDDSFFEVERGGFPSQYFFACKFLFREKVLISNGSIFLTLSFPLAFPFYYKIVSPHHPLAYFAVSATIERLILLASSLSQHKMIPFITGPGALKSAMVSI